MGKEPAQREIKQERAARTRVEILEAAINLFSRRGFLATTMADLSRAIRMTPGALYWHFPTKEDLLLAAIEELHSRYQAEFLPLLTERRILSGREQLVFVVSLNSAEFTFSGRMMLLRQCMLLLAVAEVLPSIVLL